MNAKAVATKLIIGLGKTGLSVARFLNQQGEAFIVVDSRAEIPNKAQVMALEHCVAVLDSGFNALAQSHLTNLEQAIVSPGVAQQGELFEQIQQQDIELVGDIELFARQVTKPVIAITGSNGKSTVTELTGELLKAADFKVAVGGNIGTPALELLDETVDFYVLELSSFQLETCKTLTPVVATVLNITEDHLDRYPSFEAYAQTKLKLLKFAQAVVVPTELAKQYQVAADKLVSVTEQADYCRSQDGEQLVAGAHELVKVNDLKLVGMHNYLNVLVAIGLCELAGVKFNQKMRNRLCAWRGLAHRCEFIATINGVHCYNDSKATNVGATVAAIEGLQERYQGRLLLIAGGMGKGADFSPLAEIFKRVLKALLLIGVDAEKIMHQAGREINSFVCGSLDKAMEKAFEIAESGDAILLSPACASMDMYQNFEARGEHFKQLVEARL